MRDATKMRKRKKGKIIKKRINDGIESIKNKNSDMMEGKYSNEINRKNLG